MNRYIDSRLRKLEQTLNSGFVYYMVQVLDDGIYKIFYSGHHNKKPHVMTEDEYHAFSTLSNTRLLGITGMDVDEL